MKWLPGLKDIESKFLLLSWVLPVRYHQVTSLCGLRQNYLHTDGRYLLGLKFIHNPGDSVEGLMFEPNYLKR